MAVDIWDPNVIKELAGGWAEEEEKDFFKNDKPQEFTVEYYERSWPDALKYGFLSANLNSSGRYLRNVQVGDTVYCHIAGSGFVGIGECKDVAVPMGQFYVDIGGQKELVGSAPWIQESDKKKLDPNKELFIRINWKKYVSNQDDGYWEKGMISVPLVAYTLSDKSTYKKVQEHFDSL